MTYQNIRCDSRHWSTEEQCVLDKGHELLHRGHFSEDHNGELVCTAWGSGYVKGEYGD